MRRRCLPSDRHSKDYWSRGIRVCARWRDSYENFIADMGRRPGPGYSIDRKDNDGDYTPENCRWATKSEQANNTRRQRTITFHGKQIKFYDWAEIIWKRLSEGLDAEDVLGPIGETQ